ncbi:tripartite tricarboxylate transporter TctB family protein [Flindersiella endophytica]
MSEVAENEGVEQLEHAEDRRTLLASGALGGLLLLAAVFALVQAGSLWDVGSSVILGPAAFPLLIGLLLVVVGAALIVRAVLRVRTIEAFAGSEAGGAEAEGAEAGGSEAEGAEAADRSPRGRLVRVGLLLVLLVAFALLLPYAGYVVSSALLFTGTALLLDSPHRWRTLAAGWTLAAVVFLAFDRLIGLTLPTGPWGF